MKTIVCFLFVLAALSAQGEVFFSKVGQKAFLKCGVKSYPKQLSWSANDGKIINVDKRGFPRKGTSAIAERSRILGTTLEISPVKATDAGTFTCEADTSTHHHTLVVVSVSVAPSANLQLGSKATLSCQVYPQGKAQKIHWKRTDADGSQHNGPEMVLSSVTSSDEGSWECAFTYEGKTHSESITISVHEPTPKATTASNSKTSPKIPCNHCGQPGDTDHKLSNDFQLLGLKWWVWLLIGVGSLFVILLIILVIITCRTIRRRKRRFQMMKNAQHQMRPKNYCKCDRSTAAKPQQGRRREKPSALPLKPLLM